MPIVGDDPQLLTKADIDVFEKRVMRTFRGDQCAYDAMTELQSLALVYDLPETNRTEQEQ